MKSTRVSTVKKVESGYKEPQMFIEQVLGQTNVIIINVNKICVDFMNFFPLDEMIRLHIHLDLNYFH